MDAPRSPPHCPVCGYNLTGLTEPRCPECGYQFTPQEWADLTIHGVMPARPPAWERRDSSGMWRFGATVLAMALRPTRVLRGLRGDGGVLRATGFALLLVLLAPVLSIALCAAVGHLGQLLPYRPLHEYPFNACLVHRQPIPALGGWLLHCALLTTAFLAAGILVWLPMLVVLDLCYWRSRAPFRLVAKALLYTIVWYSLAGALAAGPVNGLLLRFDNDWVWGFRGGGSYAGAWPWICWLAAGLATLQFGALLWLLRSRQSSFALESPRTRRRIALILSAGWILALYLLRFDRHIHLRFHLQFFVEEAYAFFEKWGWQT